MTDASQYNFTVAKGAEPNTIALRMVDSWGWTITGTAVRQPDGSYAGTANVGDKGALNIPFVDGEAK